MRNQKSGKCLVYTLTTLSVVLGFAMLLQCIVELGLIHSRPTKIPNEFLVHLNQSVHAFCNNTTTSDNNETRGDTIPLMGCSKDGCPQPVWSTSNQLRSEVEGVLAVHAADLLAASVFTIMVGLLGIAIAFNPKEIAGFALYLPATVLIVGYTFFVAFKSANKLTATPIRIALPLCDHKHTGSFEVSSEDEFELKIRLCVNAILALTTASVLLLSLVATFRYTRDFRQLKRASRANYVYEMQDLK